MSEPKIYVIKAGQHAAANRFPWFFWGQYIAFNVTFDHTAEYQFKEPGNALDVSKLYGFSESWNPHKNSARFGWAFVDGKLRLYAYVYCNGKRTIKELCVIEKGVTYRCMIAIYDPSNDKYAFSVVDTHKNIVLASITIDRGNDNKKAFGYKLFPYVGGDETIDHDVRIKIEKL